jgi:hypothetical protein
MPFQSEAQRRFMYAKHPGIAKRWQEHTPKGKQLPEKKAAMCKLAFNLGYRLAAKKAEAEKQAAAFGLLKSLRGLLGMTGKGVASAAGKINPALGRTLNAPVGQAVEQATGAVGNAASSGAAALKGVGVNPKLEELRKAQLARLQAKANRVKAPLN